MHLYAIFVFLAYFTLYNRLYAGNPKLVLCDNLEGWGGEGGGRGIQEGGITYMPMADSC